MKLPLTEDRRVYGEEPGKGDVGEQSEAAAGDQPDPQLLGLDPAQLPRQPRRRPPLAGQARRLGRPRVRRGRHENTLTRPIPPSKHKRTKSRRDVEELFPFGNV